MGDLIKPVREAGSRGVDGRRAQDHISYMTSVYRRSRLRAYIPRTRTNELNNHEQYINDASKPLLNKPLMKTI